MRKTTVIKADAPTAAQTLRLQAFHIDDVMCDAHERVAAAQRQAQTLLQQARTQAQEIRRAAREEGLREGREEGYRQGEQAGRTEALAAVRCEFAERQASVVSAFRQVVGEIDGHRADWLAAAHQDLVDLAMAIARRVAHHVGQRDREVVLANLEEAVRLTGARSEVTIAVHPLDAEATRLFGQSLIDLREEWQNVRVVEEPEVSPGGARVHFGSGSVDASLDTQLDRIEAELKSAN
ncbi:MAG: hypothetical protein AMXMBFR13_37160 [Phycisphaerae bacterium]